VTVTPEERTALCQKTDWHRYGVNDGRLGVSPEARAPMFSDCTELGAPADLVAYQSGRGEGLKEFCSAENGYRQGYRGRRYRRVCPSELEPDFLQGYELGRRERPAFFLVPGFSFGIGGGGAHSGIRIGVGGGGYYPNYYGRHCWRGSYGRCW